MLHPRVTTPIFITKDSVHHRIYYSPPHSFRVDSSSSANSLNHCTVRPFNKYLYKARLCPQSVSDNSGQLPFRLKMDSMRSLNTSLPSSKRQRSAHPQTGLHQAFKAAAFSVTQLYKAAAADEDAARSAGYQDALEELLGFLDDNSLGLGDGEGWRVRQWATERLTPDVYASDSSEEDVGSVERRRTESPEKQRKVEEPPVDSAEPAAGNNRPSASEAKSIPQQPQMQQPGMFHFTANTQMPDIDMNAPSRSPPRTSPPTSIHLNVQPSCSPHRRRKTQIATPVAASLGQGAGTKRRASANVDLDSLAKYWHAYGGGGFDGAKRRKWDE